MHISDHRLWKTDSQQAAGRDTRIWARGRVEACEIESWCRKNMGREGAAAGPGLKSRGKEKELLECTCSVARMGAKLSVPFAILTGGEGRNELETGALFGGKEQRTAR